MYLFLVQCGMNKRIVAKQFRVGGDRNFGYLAADGISKKAVIIDPSFSPERILDYVKTNDYIVQYVFNTHNHSDHTNGNSFIESRTGLKVLHYLSIDSA